MISAVSGVNFRGEKTDFNSLINQPGKYAAGAPASQPAQPEGDKAELSTSVPKEEKSNTGKVIGGIIGALALVWIGLGIAVGHKGSKWTKLDAPEGLAQNAKNFFYNIGKSASDAYDSTLGKWFGKKADDAANTAEEASTKASK